jgi:UDP-2-acetamido-3-amino-2,3-dideoxy-glucuronate N-acetyltransferase
MRKGMSIALVGFGDWGRNIARNLASLDALHWVCDLDPSRLADASLHHKKIQTTDSLASLLADGDVTAVMLATPAPLHYAHARASLLADKDVFVEKPLALQPREGEELVRLANERGKILMVGHVLEYHPAIARIEELLRSDVLGPIWYAYSNRVNLGKVRQEESILWSFAPHDIAILCRLFGAAPTSVNAVGAQYLQPNIADVTMTHLTFSESQRAHIFVSWLHPYKEQRLVVIGEKKMLSFDGTGDGTLTLYDKGIDWKDGLPVSRNAHEEQISFEGGEPLRRECEHFLDCIKTRQTPITSGESALRVLRVLAAAQRSIETGGPVTL